MRWPTIAPSPGCRLSGRMVIEFLDREAVVDLHAGFALGEALAQGRAIDRDPAPVPAHEQARRGLLGPLPVDELGANAGATLRGSGDLPQLGAPGRVLALRIAAARPQLDRGDETGDLLLAHLEVPPHAAVRRGVERGRGDPFRLADQQPGRLRPAQILAPGIDDHRGAAGEPGLGPPQEFRRGIDHHRDAVRPRQRDAILELQRRGRIGGAQHVDHRRGRERGFHLRARGDLDDLEAGRAHRVVVGEARAARGHDEAPRPVDLRQLRDALGIAERRGARRTDEQRAGSARGDQRRRGADQLGDAPSRGLEEQRHVHEAGRRRDHRLEHLGRHAAAAVDRARAAAIDEAAQAQQLERIGIGAGPARQCVSHDRPRAPDARRSRVAEGASLVSPRLETAAGDRSSAPDGSAHGLQRVGDDVARDLAPHRVARFQRTAKVDPAPDAHQRASPRRSRRNSRTVG